MGFCNCSMFCCVLLCANSSFAIISMRKRELVALLCLSSWCLVIVAWLFLVMPQVCLQFVIVVFPDHTHLLFSVTSVSSDLRNVMRSKCAISSASSFGTLGPILSGTEDLLWFRFLKF